MVEHRSSPLPPTAGPAWSGLPRLVERWIGFDQASEPADIRRSMRGPVRLRTLTALRWLAVLGQTAAVLTVHFGFGFPLNLGLCLGAIALSVWLNIFAALRYSPQYFLTDQEAVIYIGFDILQLCAMLALTGGLSNPFAVLILAPVTIAASVLPARPTVALALLALIGVSIIGIWHLPLPWHDGDSLETPRMYAVGVWVSLAFSVGFFSVYAHRIAAEAGEMKSALAATQLALAREEQLAAIGGLAAAAAHELGTPLATIQVTSKEMVEDLRHRDKLDLDLLAEDAELLLSQSRRCREILGRLSRRDVEGGDILHQAGFDLLVQQAAAPFEEGPDAPAIVYETMATPDAGPPPVVSRKPEILYGLRNVVENAAAFARSTVLIHLEWDAEMIGVTIHDDGPGFAPDILARLGEPYLSERLRSATGRKTGMGLGFFIAKTLLERSGGEVRFANRKWPDAANARASHGAWVQIRWPRAALEEAVG